MKFLSKAFPSGIGYFCILLLFLFILVTSANAASIIVQSSSENKTLYLDGMYLCITPVDTVVVRDGGYHFVSFFTHEMNRNTLPPMEKFLLRKIVDLSTQSFYLENDDSITIQLNWESTEELIKSPSNQTD